jgi:hypothetical protein
MLSMAATRHDMLMAVILMLPLTEMIRYWS